MGKSDQMRQGAQVARELKVHDGTLGNWVAKYRDEHRVSESPQSDRVRDLRRGATPPRDGVRGRDADASLDRVQR